MSQYENDLRRTNQIHPPPPSATRVTGPIGKAVASGLKGNPAVALRLYRQMAFRVTLFRHKNGRYPTRSEVPKLPPYDSSMPEQVAQIERAYINADGKPSANPMVVMFMCPWAKEYLSMIIKSDRESQVFYSAALNINKAVTSKVIDPDGVQEPRKKKGSDFNALRTFVDQPNNRNGRSTCALVTELSTQLRFGETTAVSVIGGGNLFKENALINGTITENIEDNSSNLYKEPTSAAKVSTLVQATTSLALNSMTQRGMPSVEEAMEKAGTSLFVNVTPTDIKSEVASRNERRIQYSASDDPLLFKKYNDAMPPLDTTIIRGGENKLTYTVKKIEVPLLEEDIIKEKKIGPAFNAYLQKITHSPQIAVLRKGTADAVPARDIVVGDISFCKPKYDGVSHSLVIRSNNGRSYVSITPRTIDEGRPFIAIQNREIPYCNASLTANIELMQVDDKMMAHVTRTYSVNGVESVSNVQLDHELEKKMTLGAVQMCLGQCNCPTDGVILHVDNKELYAKDTCTRDVLSDFADVRDSAITFITYKIAKLNAHNNCILLPLCRRIAITKTTFEELYTPIRPTIMAADFKVETKKRAWPPPKHPAIKMQYVGPYVSTKESVDNCKCGLLGAFFNPICGHTTHKECGTDEHSCHCGEKHTTPVEGVGFVCDLVDIVCMNIYADSSYAELI